MWLGITSRRITPEMDTVRNRLLIAFVLAAAAVVLIPELASAGDCWDYLTNPGGLEGLWLWGMCVDGWPTP